MGRQRTVGWLGVTALVVAACSGCVSETPPPRPSVQSVDIESEFARHLLDMFNRERLTAGLSPLTWNASAAGLAYRYSGELRHAEGAAASEGTAGRTYVASSGNLAAFRHILLAQDVDDVYRGLMERAEGREIVLSESAIDAGIGIAVGAEVAGSIAGRRKFFVTVMVRMLPRAELLTAAAPPPAGDGPTPSPAGDEAAPQTVPPTLLEGWRISGTRYIVPDDDTKTDIMIARRRKLIGSFKLCIATDGTIDTIQLLKSTQFPAYDVKIMREMRRWRYRPYEVNGKRVPVCTAVTFIYTQT